MRASTIKITFLGLFLLQSCAVVDRVFVENRGKPGPDANTVGIIGTSKPGGGLEEVKSAMVSNCADWGGLNESSIYAIPKLQGGKMFTDYWGYKCNGLYTAQPKSSAAQPIQNSANSNVDIETAKQKCTDLGFKNGTDGFGKCVLQLSK